MLILLPILLLLLSAAAILLLGRQRPRYSNYWLLASGGAFFAWISIWVLRGRLQTTFKLTLSGSNELFPIVPELLVDAVSWPFALALATLVLAVILTDVARIPEARWQSWAGDLGITALGILAVLAGNPLTLVMAWMLIDILEIYILFRQVETPEIRQRIMVFFSTNLLGIMLVLWAMMISRTTGLPPLTFTNISPAAAVFMIMASGLRIGVFPIQVAYLQNIRQQRGQGMLIRLVPPAASLVLLVRTAHIGVSANWELFLFVFAAVAAVYGGISWTRAKDELSGRIFWMVGVSGLAFASALQSSPAATLAWSLVLLYSGAILFLTSMRETWMLPIGLLGLFNLTTLPLSPTMKGAELHSHFHILSLILIIAQTALILGYIRHMVHPAEKLEGVERWVRVIYPLGLAFLPLTHFLAGNWFAPSLGVTSTSPIWPGLIVLLLVTVLGFLTWRGIQLPDRAFSIFDQLFSLDWFYRLLGWVYNTIGQALAFVTSFLEGEGGVLWALLLVALLVSLISQLSAGGGS